MKHFCLELKRFSRGKIFERGRPQQDVISLKINMLADKNVFVINQRRTVRSWLPAYIVGFNCGVKVWKCLCNLIHCVSDPNCESLLDDKNQSNESWKWLTLRSKLFLYIYIYISCLITQLKLYFSKPWFFFV